MKVLTHNFVQDLELEIAGHMKKMEVISQETLEAAISELEYPIRQYPSNFK